MSKNEKLYDIAMRAIRDLFDDQTVTRETALENLNSLIEEIAILVESLQE